MPEDQDPGRPAAAPSHNGHRPLYLRRPPVRREQGAPGLARTVAPFLVLAAAAAAGLAVTGVLGGSAGPLLPSGHTVDVVLRAPTGSHTRAQARLVSYPSGHLLLLTLQATGLDPGSRHALLLTHTVGCGGSTAPTRLVGSLRATPAGAAEMNAEVSGITDLRFGAWALWLTVGPPQLGRAGGVLACGEIRLAPLA